MAGHNKWSKVKRLKAVADGRRSKVYSRLIREMTIAAKAGGGDPAANPRLRTLVSKARDANMPMDNVERAIKKGTGELPGIVFEEITYEGYGPGGVAFVVQVTTDNKKRAAQDVRAAFTKFGGNLAGSGAVMFQFVHAGQFLIDKDQGSEEVLMDAALEAGADDVVATDEGFEIRCPVHSFDKVAHALEEKKLKAASAEIAYIPTNTVAISDVNLGKAIVELQESLDGLDDVQHVFSNEEMDDRVSAAAHAGL